MIKLSEIIKVPIEIGDTVLGGKFKNKRIVVKSIGKNDKGDITINNKPMMKFRLLNKDEGTCGYSIDGKPADKPAGPHLLKKKKKKFIDTQSGRIELEQKIKEALGPSDDQRRIMMLKLYGSNLVTNYKRLLAGIENEKRGIVKKSWKDFQAMYKSIEKKIEEII
tara:strand:- start:95 stop:589 length:495 start_codon:yes stop_codon:yes gene_type:complete